MLKFNKSLKLDHITHFNISDIQLNLAMSSKDSHSKKAFYALFSLEFRLLNHWENQLVFFSLILKLKLLKLKNAGSSFWLSLKSTIRSRQDRCLSITISVFNIMAGIESESIHFFQKRKDLWISAVPLKVCTLHCIFQQTGFVTRAKIEKNFRAI